MTYTGGWWSGTLATDVVSLLGSVDEMQPTQAYLALIESSREFFIRGAQWEGILGLAYSSLARVSHEILIFAL